MGGLCPLFFDGAVCQFDELPKPDDKEAINKIYSYLRQIRGNTSKSFFSFGIRKNNRRLQIKNILHKFVALFK